MRRDEGGIGQELLPLLADLDEVVAVCAIAVQEDDELLRRAGTGQETGTGEFGHERSFGTGAGLPESLVRSPRSSPHGTRCGAPRGRFT